ncbi:ABC transporter ATP-binding protein [Hyphomicrobium sp.]|uniref:ABC transporter ATP-binding protein n=1 Tax=Hyphomicrobium sp. TaxID=82 RepID=UPI003F72482D
MAALIEAVGLQKTFGPIKAVDGISLSVEKGEVLGFLGPNGAGKSTTMKMITGFLEPDAGTARICGFDVLTNPKAAKSRLGYLPEGAPAYADMTPASFLSFIAEIRGFNGDDGRTRVAAAVAKAGLGGVLDQRIETLSKGFKRRVGIAQAILHDPHVLIMDEPTDGLDPNQKHHIRELIREMAAHKAIIVSTHILEEVEAVCTRAVVIDKGRIVADGTAEDLLRRAPNHGAVAVRLAREDADGLKTAMAALPSVARVEMTAGANGTVQLRAMPRNSAAPLEPIADLLRREQISVEEIYVERGRLDDVFREITTPVQA